MAKPFSKGRYRTTRKQFGLGTVLVNVVAGMLLIGVSIFFYNANTISSSWIKVDGTVVGAAKSINSSNNGSHNYLYAPVVGYKVNGVEHRVTSSEAITRLPSVGDRHQVAYNPADPDEAKVITGGWSKAAIWFCAAIGGFMIIASLAVYASNVMRLRRQ